MNTFTTAHWQDLSRRHLLAPFTDYRQLNEKGARIITRAEGVHLWDSEGQRILDEHGHERLVLDDQQLERVAAETVFVSPGRGADVRRHHAA